MALAGRLSPTKLTSSLPTQKNYRENAPQHPWTPEKVAQWLRSQGYESVVLLFQDLQWHGQRFLCITPADLEDYVQHCLTANDRAHLAYKIQALRHSTTPPYQGDQGPSAGYDGYNRNQRGSPAQTNPTDSRPFHSLPQHGHAYANHRTPTHRTAYSPPPNSRDYNKIRPVIPERTSSNTTEITRILESLNYEMPTIRHIGSLGRGRTLSSYPRTHMASTRPSFYDPAADAPQAPVAAQAQANDQASYWKWARKYIPQPIQDFTLSSKEKRFVQEHRIQVTTNKSVFRILTIPDNYNAIMIKQSILIKVEMKGDPERYHFYHENGSRQDLTLGDEELVDICKRSDNSLTNRIFVKPVDYVQHGWASKTLAEPATDIHSHSRLANNNPMSMKNRYPNMYPPPGQQPIYYEGYDPVWYGHNAERLGHCVLPVAATNPLHEPHIIHSLSQGLNTPLPRNDPHIANGNTTSHLQMSQQKGYSFEPRTNGLPRTYARKNSQPLTNTSLVENSTHPSNPPSTPSSSHPGSMWAVRPSNSSPVPNSMWAVQPTKTPTSSDSTPSSLWPVESQYIESRKNRDSPPIKSITSSTVSEGSTTDTVYGGSSFKKLADVEGITLYDPPQSGSKEHYLHDPSEPSTPTPFDPSASSFPSSSTLTNIIKTTKTDEINDALWEVRPSVDTLFEDIDAYLPGHDLDKAMIVDPLQQPMPLPTASSKPLCTLGPSKSIRVVAKEAHNNWRKSTKVTRNSNMLRRRSTKMWGTNVQQIKPGTTTMSQVIGKNKISGEKTDDTPTTRWMRGRLIGIGTYGRVYHAFNLDAKEWIAVKVVELPTTPSDMINKDLCEAAETIYREAELLTGLKHDNIVQYLGSDVDMEKGHIHIFLEYVAGGSISTCLTRNGCFDEPLVRYFTRQILSGLKYLHDLNILHRDIKAGNILVDEYGVCKIADFGLSKEGDEYEAYNVNADHSSMRGTVFWMAPEVVRGRKYNAKIDIWSLGCTVIEMLTGKHPWVDFHSVATIFQLGNEQAPPLPSNISDEARSFLNKCLTIEAEDRPTAAELLKDPFVQEYPDFELKKHIIKLGIERKISQRMAK